VTVSDETIATDDDAMVAMEVMTDVEEAVATMVTDKVI
jgi:hypothetical protein